MQMSSMQAGHVCTAVSAFPSEHSFLGDNGGLINLGIRYLNLALQLQLAYKLAWVTSNPRYKLRLCCLDGSYEEATAEAGQAARSSAAQHPFMGSDVRCSGGASGIMPQR